MKLLFYCVTVRTLTKSLHVHVELIILLGEPYTFLSSLTIIQSSARACRSLPKYWRNEAVFLSEQAIELFSAINNVLKTISSITYFYILLAL